MNKKLVIGSLAFAISVVSIYASAINLRVGGTGYAWKDAGRVFVVENTVDFSQHESATNQVFEMIQITAPAIVHAIYWSVDSAANAGVTFEVGDATTANGFIAATTATNVAKGASQPAYTYDGTNVLTTGYSAGKFYAANASINLKTPAAIPTTGKVTIKALVSYFGE